MSAYSDARDAVLELLNDRPREWFTVAEICDTLGLPRGSQVRGPYSEAVKALLVSRLLLRQGEGLKRKVRLNPAGDDRGMRRQARRIQQLAEYAERRSARERVKQQAAALQAANVRPRTVDEFVQAGGRIERLPGVERYIPDLRRGVR